MVAGELPGDLEVVRPYSLEEAFVWLQDRLSKSSGRFTRRTLSGEGIQWLTKHTKRIFQLGAKPETKCLRVPKDGKKPMPS
jgi:hypothetical protein